MGTTTMFAALMTRLRGLLQRRRVAREIDDELRFHVEMETHANVARGLSQAEARRRTLADLGGVDQTKEAVRDVRAIWLDAVWRDARHACRSLWRRPGPGLAAITMLGVGIGLTTAMFTLVDALILRPAPFDEPDQLAFVYMGGDTGGRTTVAPGVLRAWRESPAFAGAEAAVPDIALVEVAGTVVTRGIARITPGLFDLLGPVRPVRGRLFDAADSKAGNRVILAEGLWRTLFDADPAVVGRRITVDDESLMVVGVLPAAFRFPSWDTVIWRAADFDALLASARDQYPMAYVRFAGGIPREDALRIATQAAREADPRNAELRPLVEPLAGLVLDAYYERAVPLLAGGVVLVFLVLCANVCSLLLGRLTTRQREFAMRSALGGTRAGLARQAFIESSVLGALSVIAGIAIAWALVSLVRAYLPEAFMLRTLNPLDVDVRALAVTSVSGVIAMFLAGLLPAVIGTRVNVDTSLRVTDRGGTDTRPARMMTRALLVGEIAFACALLVGATLLVRSFINVSNVERGLETSGVLTAAVWMADPAFPDETSRAAAVRVFDEQLRELPGAEQVVWSSGVPPGGGGWSIGNWVSDAPGAPVVATEMNRYHVGPDFFELYNIPLLRGRTMQLSDPQDAVVVGERLANMLWPGLDPVGRTFSFEGERFHVIGLVQETHYPSLLAHTDLPEFYEPFTGVGRSATMSLRCRRTCPDVALVRQRLLAAHPAVRVWEVGVLDDTYAEQLARPRAAAALGFTFAGVAVLAAAGGLFSVLSYAVRRRRREFGVRAAMGASPLQLQRLVVREGLAVALMGITLGTATAWAGGRVLASLQYGVTVTDPLSWTVVVGLLACTTVAASWLPARHAGRTDPVQLLREE